MARPKKNDTEYETANSGGDINQIDRDELNDIIQFITDHLHGYIAFRTDDIKRIQDFLLKL